MGQLDVVPFPETAYLRIISGEVSPPNECFGHHYSASAEECAVCTAPVVHEERVYLVKELCRERTTGQKATTALAKNLKSRDVQDRLARGMSVQEILDEMAGPGADEATVRVARNTLRNRLAYLASKDLPVPDLPPPLA